MKREYWWAILALAIAVVLAYTLVSVFKDAESKIPYDCVDPTERERIRELAFKGIDDGLVRAMTHLFDVWQKDPQSDQPKRAQVGTTNAINAHNRARKFAIEWDPPSCPKEP